MADAVGYQVEFSSLHEILSLRPGGVTGPLADKPLEASDDTQMTLFTLEGLARAARHDGVIDPHAVLVSVREAYLDWNDTQVRSGGRVHAGNLASLRAMRLRQAPGLTCLGALAAGGHGTIDKPINDSKGCGGVMRSAPVGLLPGILPSAAFDLGAGTAAFTHGNPDGWASAGAMAALVRLLVTGHTLESAIGIVSLLCPSQAARTAFLLGDALAASRGPALSPEDMVSRLGAGWVGEEALAVGVYAALSGTDFADVVRIGATHSGDSDSTASIAGQLVGAARGMACLPGDWWEAVDLRDVIVAQARAFCTAWAIPVPDDRPVDVPQFPRRGLWARITRRAN